MRADLIERVLERSITAGIPRLAIPSDLSPAAGSTLKQQEEER